MKKIFLILFTCLLATSNTFAKEDSNEEFSSRFVSIKDEIVNSRSGPGTRYPIEWIYKQKHAPLEVINEFKEWRQVRDWQGSESWILSQLLSGKRYAKVITPGENNIYQKSNYKSKVVAKVEDGAIAEIKKCPAGNEFCLLSFENINGWLPRQNLFGVHKNEVID